MNTKNIKIIFYLLASAASAVLSMLLVAVFTLDYFQSWPRAIWEGRVVVYCQFLFTFLFLKGGRWVHMLAAGLIVAAYCIAGWGLITSSKSWMLHGGILIWAVFGGYCFARLARTLVPPKVIRWIANPWRN